MKSFNYIKQYDPDLKLSYCLSYDTSNIAIVTECNNNTVNNWIMRRDNKTLRSLAKDNHCMTLQPDNTLKIQKCDYAVNKIPIEQKWHKIDN